MSEAAERKWLRPMLASVRPALREVVALSFFINLLALATPIFVLQVYDRVVYFAGLGTLAGLSAGMAIVVVFDYVVRQARARVLQAAAIRLDVAVTRRLYDKLAGLRLAELEGRPAGFWLLLFRDVETIRNTLSGATAVLIGDLPFAILFLGLVLLIAGPIAWVLLIVAAGFVLLAWGSGAVVRGAAEGEKQAALGRDSFLAEWIAGRSTVKALDLARAMQADFGARHAALIEASVVRGGRADALHNLGQTLTIVATVAMTAVRALAIVEQRLSIGALVAANMLATRIIGPLNQLVTTWRGLTAFRQSVARLGDVFALDEDRRESAVALPRASGQLTLEDLSFAFREGAKPVIDAIKIRIEPGSLTAILGPNGGGKTTLLRLLCGLYVPTHGRVLLDGADIAQYSRRDLARQIGYMPQECVLFAGTIRDNIASARPDADDAAIIAAAERAGLHRLVVDLAEGYGTQVGEGGGRLSGGMRQRIALARTLIGDPPVLLLDEPSSNLDRQAEEHLRDTLASLARDHTILLVTHSPVLLPATHNLVVLQAGRIAAAGTTAELLPRLAAGPRVAALRPPQASS
jgi:PrtD family type I secretion system ABC transporter